ncbi:MAG: MATE family efflux transporter [Eubacteriales bacterium]|nr:MATE family efflux transporter [Eubacteriales bacterium]
MEASVQKKTTAEKLKQIASIGIPAVIESIISVLIGSIDTKMISGLGKGAVSAVSFTSQPKLIILSIFFAMGTAVSVFVAQALGRKDGEEANAYFQTILRITVILSLVLGILCGLLAVPIMSVCNRQPDTVGMSISFFRIIMFFLVFNTVSIVLNAALRGIGKTRLTLISSVSMGVVDIFVNYLLIEGHWGFPKLGVVGDALGTVCGMATACVISILLISRRSEFLSLKGIFTRKNDPEIMKNVHVKVGNTVIENLFTRIGFLLSSIIISSLSSDVTAVYSVTMILLNYSFSFGDGLQAAVVTLTGQSMGAKQYREIKDYVRLSRILGVVVSVVLSAVYIIFARRFFNQFFQDEEAIAQGISYTYVAAGLTLLQIIRIINVAAMRGMGEVKAPRIMATVCVLIISPAVAFTMTSVLHYGVWGIWAASVTSQICWFIMSCVKEHQCMQRVLSLESA